MSKAKVWIIICLVGLLSPWFVLAQGEATTAPPVKAVVTKVHADSASPSYDLRLLSGTDHGKNITTGSDQGLLSAQPKYRVGNHVYVQRIDKQDGSHQYVINDYDRAGSLWWLVILFVLVVVWFSRWRGVRSLVGLFLSFVVIIGWVVPHIAHGGQPVPTAILGSTVVLFVGFILTEGFTRLMWATTLGTVATMVVIGLLSAWTVGFTHLTGNGTEEAFSLQNLGVTIDLRGLLLAGIIIGTLGLLEDIAVGQAATVGELRHANPRLPGAELYRRALRVGQSHLSAIINTLTLAYAGSALPLLVLFSLSQQSAAATISSELISTEIVRSLVGSIGLVLAIPITTAIAVWLKVQSSGAGEHAHHH